MEEDDEERHAIGLGLVLYGDPEKRWRVQAEDFAKLRSALGDPLLAQFARCFTLSNQLTSIFDLIGMNYRTAEKDSPRQHRNLQTLAFVVAGQVQELSDVLTALRREGLETFLSAAGSERWAALAAFEHLAEKKTIKTIRNELAFHAVTDRVIRAGIDALDRSKLAVSVMAGDGHQITHANVTIGNELAFAGLKLEQDALRIALTEVRNAHFSTIAFIKELFVDVLRAKGANFRPLEPLTEEQRARLELKWGLPRPRGTAEEELSPPPDVQPDEGKG